MFVRGAKAVILDSNKNVLIVRRSKTHPHAPLTNDLPGGKIEEGETMVQGLVREIQEEVGIDVRNDTPKLIDSKKVQNFFNKNYEVELYEIELSNRPSITLSFEHDKYEWVPLKEATIIAELFEDIFEVYKSTQNVS